MKISQLAKRSNISAHTLRYYEKLGLFTASKRSDNNYRDYNEDDLATAQFIHRCKQTGFSLDDIRSLLGIKEAKQEHICAEAKAITLAKIDQIRRQIKQLTQMEHTLSELAEKCCGGNESALFCSIIAKLESDDMEVCR